MTRPVLILATLLAVVLSACSSPPPAKPVDTAPGVQLGSSMPPASAPSTESGFSSLANERNNIPKRLTEPAGMLCPPNPTDLATCDVRFTIERVSGCEGSGFEGEPVDGVRRIAWFTIATSADYGSTDYSGDHSPVTITSADMQAIDGAGVTRPAGVSTFWKCVPSSKQLPDTWRRGSKYSGGVEVVVPNDARILVVAPSWSPGGWEFPVA